jgi:hypothetical protein
MQGPVTRTPRQSPPRPFAGVWFRPAIAIAACAVSAWLVVAPPGIAAQPPAPTPSIPPAAPAPAPPDAPNLPLGRPKGIDGPAGAAPVIMLADEPFHLDSMGMSILFPAETRIQAAEIGGSPVVQAVAIDGSYQMSLQALKVAPGRTEVAELINELRRGIAARAPIYRDQATSKVIGVGVKDLVEPVEVRLGALRTPGQRMYLAVDRQGSVRDPVRDVEGYTVVRPLPDTFVILRLTCDERQFDRARRAFELSSASAQFADASALMSARQSAVAAAKRFLERLDAPKLDVAIHEELRWFRWYRPAAGSDGGGAKGADRGQDAELGYRAVRFWKGRRAELNGPDGRLVPASPDNPDGYLAQVIARLIVERQAEGGGVGVADIEGTYFSSADRASEFWATNTVLHPAGAREAPSSKRAARHSETGARTGRRLNVSIFATGAELRTISPLVEPDTYVSQVESLLLSTLLANAGNEDDFAFTAYRAQTESIGARRETLRRAQGLASSLPRPAEPGAAGDDGVARAGGWVLRTRLTQEGEPQRSVLSASGELIRQELPDGSVWEPIEAEALLELWRSKGLPTGPIDAARPTNTKTK